MNLQICYLKIDVSCEASINFHHVSQNATPATEFAPRRHLTQPWFAKTRNATRLKCCACHTKWRWTRPKCCACHQNCPTHLLKTSQKYCACHTKQLSARHETRLNVTKCHACHVKRSNATCQTSKNDPFCKTYYRHGHTALTQTVANGCGRLRTVANGCRKVERTHPQTPDPQSETGTLATHSGKTRYHFRVSPPNKD